MHFIWDINPVAFSFLGVTFHWYGIFFASSILVGLQVLKSLFRAENRPTEALDSMFIYMMIGIVVGARLTHCLVYAPAFYLANPLEIFKVWKGGLASHGGGLGAILVAYYCSRKTDINFIWLLDRLTIPTLIVAASIRIGNFFNSEIFGTPTNLPWAVVFARIDQLPRHPTQLYEALAYFIVLAVLFFIWAKHRPRNGFMFGTFLATVFSVRFLLEYVKEDQATRILNLPITAGQLLSVPFVLVGVFMIIKIISDDRGGKKALTTGTL